MRESALVELFRIDNVVYCKEQTYSLGSKAAAAANEKIKELENQGFVIVSLETMSIEEQKGLLNSINEEIAYYERLGESNVTIHVKERDLNKIFNEDGTSKISTMVSATDEITKLLVNPEGAYKLKTIKVETFYPTYSHERKERGYKIPVKTYGDFIDSDWVYWFLILKGTKKEIGNSYFRYSMDIEKEKEYCKLCEAAYSLNSSEETQRKFVEEEQKREKYLKDISSYLKKLRYKKNMVLQYCKLDERNR